MITLYDTKTFIFTIIVIVIYILIFTLIYNIYLLYRMRNDIKT